MKRGLLVALALAAVPLDGFAQVTPDRILRAETTPSEWLTYSGNYQSHRFSPRESTIAISLCGTF